VVSSTLASFSSPLLPHFAVTQKSGYAIIKAVRVILLPLLGDPDPLQVDDVLDLPAPFLEGPSDMATVAPPREPLAAHDGYSFLLGRSLQPCKPGLELRAFRIGFIPPASVAPQFLPQIEVGDPFLLEERSQAFSYEMIEARGREAAYISDSLDLVVSEEIQKLLGGAGAAPQGENRSRGLNGHLLPSLAWSA